MKHKCENCGFEFDYPEFARDCCSSNKRIYKCYICHGETTEENYDEYDGCCSRWCQIESDRWIWRWIGILLSFTVWYNISMESNEEMKKLKPICKCGGDLKDVSNGVVYYTSPGQKDFACRVCGTIRKLYESEWELVWLINQNQTEGYGQHKHQQEIVCIILTKPGHLLPMNSDIGW